MWQTGRPFAQEKGNTRFVEKTMNNDGYGGSVVFLNHS
jgi:hypothetical protein